MFDPKQLLKKSELEVARTKALSDLASYPAHSDEYKKIMKQIDALSKQIACEQREKLNPNTIAVILGNIGVAGLVLWFERDNVLNTKLFSFLGKPKN